MNSSKLMGYVTAAILFLVVLFCISLFLGKVNSDIATVMFILTLISFTYWLIDKLWHKPKRIKEAKAVEAQIRTSYEGKATQEEIDQKVRLAITPILVQPWWIEWTAGFFWVILILFVVRSFWIEPYRIPSGSMMPTLENGDFILVKKYEYGLRLPIINQKILEFNKPQRGDVVVFDSPTENLILIKRVIGLPGDVISYKDKQLTINGELIALEEITPYLDTLEETSPVVVPQFQEVIDDNAHAILRRPYNPWTDHLGPGVPGFKGLETQFENCTYHLADFTCTVPEGYYFMMGDNRDRSLDSRYWGFVPENNIIGRAFFIWLNISKMNRIGAFH